MRVMLTGGAGYVGSATLRHLRGIGVEAIAFDNLRLGHREALAGAPLVVGDIHDTQAVEAALREHGIEAVMHFAASAYVGESVLDPELYYRNNVSGTLSLLQAMHAARVRRLVFSSTCATFGNSAPTPIDERCPQQPENPYGRTKLAVEWLIRDCSAAYGLGYSTLRYFNAAGASADGEHGEDHDPEPHLIPLALAVALGRLERLEVFGDDYPTPDGTCIRDYVHVDDLAVVHAHALEAIEPGRGRAYNVGTGRGASVLEVIAACAAVSGRDVSHRVVARRPGDPAALVADPTRLRQDFGWAARYTDIRDIVHTAWQWHRRYPRGYAGVHDLGTGA